MTDRMDVLKKVKDQLSTHTCPSCKGPAYCAMEAGKSANLCWCMTTVTERTFDFGVCVCKNCLDIK